MLNQLRNIATRSTSILLLLLLSYLTASFAIADENQRADGSKELSIALLAAETRFDTNTIELTSDGLLALEDLLEQLKTYNEIVAIRVIGHTDDVGSVEFNKSLSTDRAKYIKQRFAMHYPDIAVLAFGLGESQPIASNQTADGRERNRRVEIQVIARGHIPEAEGSSVTNN